MVLAAASIQILMDALFPDFTLKVEFGSSKSGRGTGKLLTTMFSSMALVFLMVFILTFPATPLPKRWFPAASPDALVLATRCVVVVVGVVAASSAWLFGVRRTDRILRDM